MAFKFYKQLNSADCGHTCVRMIANYYGKDYSLEKLRSMSGYTKAGTSFLTLSKLSEKIGLRPRPVKLTFEALKSVKAPVLLHWNDNHYIVYLKSTKFKKIKVANPAVGILHYTKKEFAEGWEEHNSKMGFALLLEATPKFYDLEGSSTEGKLSLSFFFRYLQQCRSQILAIFSAYIFTLLLQLVTPFLMKSTIDIGLEGRDFGFIKLIIIAQLIMVCSSTIVSFIKSRIMVRMSNILSLSILSDFWIKLTSLPISYFDRYHTGDTLKRLGDHRILQNFVTNISFGLVYSITTFILYTFILLSFNSVLFAIFLVGNLVYLFWIWLFLPVRRKLNYQSFELGAKNQSNTIQFIQGMQDIKLNNAELSKRWGWESIQIELFRFNFKMIDYGQIQSAGALLISQVKNITLTLIVCKQVIDGEISLGTMVTVQFIIGQLSGPLHSFIGFVQQTQDAKISLERLNDVHEVENEEPEGAIFADSFPEDAEAIRLNEVSFRYPGSDTLALEKVSLEIPIGKTTAFVGMSGGGKSTLMKLLMKSYQEYDGDIRLGVLDFKDISPSYWRSLSGFVVHEGFIFNDSILNNITVGDVEPNVEWARKCCEIANIYAFIKTLPKGLNTTIGTEGIGLSQGQKQRILIARSIYKEPQFLFLDEATNSLDANNEGEIINNLTQHTKGKTVVIIAHRLSTVKNADQIVLIDGGKICEKGTHQALILQKGKYWELIEKQTDNNLQFNEQN